MERPKLTLGEKYKVQAYPHKGIYETKYEGYYGLGRIHVFSTKIDEQKTLLLVSDHWIHRDNADVITHLKYSSAPIVKVTRKHLESAPIGEKSRLIVMLNEMGVKI